MSNRLHVRVLHFKRAVMRSTARGIFRKEERVVINILFSAINVHEAGYVGAVGCGEDIGGFEVEVLGKEIERLLEFANETREYQLDSHRATRTFRNVQASRRDKDPAGICHMSVSSPSRKDTLKGTGERCPDGAS